MIRLTPLLFVACSSIGSGDAPIETMLDVEAQSAHGLTAPDGTPFAGTVILVPATLPPGVDPAQDMRLFLYSDPTVLFGPHRWVFDRATMQALQDPQPEGVDPNVPTDHGTYFMSTRPTASVLVEVRNLGASKLHAIFAQGNSVTDCISSKLFIRRAREEGVPDWDHIAGSGTDCADPVE